MKCVTIPLAATRIVGKLALLSAFAGCAAEIGPASQDDGLGDVEAAQVLLASVQLSTTHRIEFYELGPGHGLINESYQMDLGERSALRSIAIDNGDLLGVYRQLAGTAADAHALAQLEGYEQRRMQFMADTAAAAETEPAPVHAPDETIATAYDGPIEKDRDDEARWFAGRFCDSEPQPDGCLGKEGTRYPWLPTDLPVCTNIVELCGTGFADPAGFTRSSRNLRWAAYNQSDSATLSAVLTLTDPCQHDSWWSRMTTLCRKGALLRSINVGPHAAFESTSTSSASWSRRLQLTGAHPIGMKMNVY